MSASRAAHTAAALPDGRVLVAGGFVEKDSAKGAELYDPAVGLFSRVGDMRVCRRKHDAVLLADGEVLSTGGSDERDDRGVYSSSELCDPTTTRFASGAAMMLGPYKHAGTSVVRPSSRVLIAGGAPQAGTYDPRTRRFALVPGESRMAGQFSAVALLKSGGALITGGYGDGGRCDSDPPRLNTGRWPDYREEER